MNREIKFRGYDSFNQKWVYGYGLHQSIFIDGSSNAYVTAGIREVFIVDKESAGQYTGCKDANGKEIYEGDIVSSWSKGVQGKGVVKQRVDGLWIIYPAFSKGEIWGLCPNQEGISTVEVIGNMYENPELLEVK